MADSCTWLLNDTQEQLRELTKLAGWFFGWLVAWLLAKSGYGARKEDDSSKDLNHFWLVGWLIGVMNWLTGWLVRCCRDVFFHQSPRLDLYMGTTYCTSCCSFCVHMFRWYKKVKNTVSKQHEDTNEQPYIGNMPKNVRFCLPCVGWPYQGRMQPCWWVLLYLPSEHRGLNPPAKKTTSSIVDGTRWDRPI